MSRPVSEVLSVGRRHGAAPPWLASLLVALPLAGLIATLWPTLHFPWVERSTYSHGYLIAAIAAWLGYRAARDSRGLIGSASVFGLIAVTGSIAVAVVGQAADVAMFVQLAIPSIIWCTIWAVGGWPIAKRLLLPCAFLIFAIPIWDAINETLRHMTVFFVGGMLRRSAVPALIEGNMIRIPSGTFEVEGGCSGLHYLIVGAALGTVYAVLNLNRAWVRALVVAGAVAVALLSNWLRVFIIVVAGHVSHMQSYLVTVDHYYFGWALFVVALSAYFWAARGFERLDTESPAAPSGSALRLVGRIDWKVALAVIVLVGGIWLSLQAGARPAAPALVATAPEVPRATGWTVEPGWVGPSEPVYVAADAETAASFVRGGASVFYYTAWYASQDQGRELVYYANTPGGEGGQILAKRRIEAVGPGGAAADFTELEVTDSTSRRLVWYAYSVGGMPAPGEVEAKLLQVIAALRGRRDAEVVVLSAPCPDECAGARQDLEDFVRSADALFPVLATESRERE